MTAWLARLVSSHLRAAIARARRAELAWDETTHALDAAVHRAVQAEAALDEYQRALTEMTRQYRQLVRDADRAETALDAARKVIDELRDDPSWHPLSRPVEEASWRRRAQNAERACYELTERLAAYEGRQLQGRLPPIAVGSNT